MLPPRRQVLLLLLAALTGCASPALPKPPSLHLPAPAASLIAQRLDHGVILTWNTPANTTDEQANRLPLTARICRTLSTDPAKAPTDPCHPIASIPVAPGPSTFTDPLPPNLLADPPHLLAYKVELLNTNGRNAPSATVAFAASGIAPPPTGPLTLGATRAGAVVTWPLAAAMPNQARSSMELERTALTPPPKATPAGLPGRKPAPVTHLRGPEAPDPGGLVDKSVTPAATYTYTAQRVRTLYLQGERLELRGLRSPAATFTYTNKVPPATPTGLSAVVSGGFAGPQSIDLSWDPNPEQDLQGYTLFRSADGAPFLQLNPVLLPGPAFRDQTAQPSHTYRYRVTATDTNNNQSPPSSPLTQTVRP